MKCKHEACKCDAVDGKNGNCSDACANRRMNGDRCGCGHAECK